MKQTTSMYKRLEQFFYEILGRTEFLHYETDSVLIDTNGKGCLYYPESFKNLIESKAVKRMSRIFQLGTVIYTREHVSHTRLEHSKGTYYRTLELLQNLYEDENIREIIIKNNYQKYVTATLIRALLHDVGHGPFSHTMETVCNLPKGFHEEIGKRLIKEDSELREALEKIYPGLPEALQEIVERNFLGLNRIFEGQSDVDRGDFLPRDSFFANVNFQENSKTVSELFNNITLERISENGKKGRIIPVFKKEQIGNLDTFFSNRFNNYKNIYYNPKSKCYEFVFKAFAEILVQSDEDYKLKDFLLHNKDKQPEEIDLQEYISFDDVEYLKGIIEVIDKTKNPTLRKLAIMSVPPRDKVIDFYFGLMVSEEQVDKNGNREYTNLSDEEFINRLFGKIPDSKAEYEQDCLILENNELDNINSIKQQLQDVLDVQEKDLEKVGIYSWDSTITSYKNKPGEETYVKGEDDKVYEYSVHPKRKAPIQKEDIHGFCILVPILESNGYNKDQITEIRRLILENNERNKAITKLSTDFMEEK